MGEKHPCSMCGQLRDPSERCPACGNTPEVLAAELARVKKAVADMYAEEARLGGERKKLSAKIQAALQRKDRLTALAAGGRTKPQEVTAEIADLNKSIAEMNAEDVTYVNEIKKLGIKLQAALHQRNLLETAEAQRKKKQAGRNRIWRWRATQSAAPKATETGATGAGAAATPKPGTGVITEQTPDSTLAGQDRPKVPRQSSTASASSPRGRVAPLVGEAPPPEASPGSMQNLMLAIGALLIGIAAIVFAAVALSNIAPGGRLAVLGLATVGLLVSAPILTRKGLSSTAESLAAVGLALLPIDGYVIARLDVIASQAISPTLLAGIIFAATTAASLLYHRSTRLTSPRYGMVLALQPVLPLLAYDMISGPAGWALVLTAVATHDAVIARRIELSDRKRIDAQHIPTGPTESAIGWSGYRLHELTWQLHGLAVGAGLVYAVVSLMSADQVPAAARAGTTVLLATGVGLAGTLMLRRRPLRELAAGLLTLAVIGSAARVAAVAVPQRALLVTAAVVALTGLAVRALPRWARRGPQLASTLALSVISAFVVGTALRAATAPVLASLPVWAADLDGYAASVAELAGQPGWHLAATVALLTVAAALALPPTFRREAALVGAALTALTTPAALGLPWAASQLVLTPAAIALLAAGIVGPGLGLARLLATPPWAALAPLPETGTLSVRCARIHVGCAVTVAAAATALAAARPWSTAAVLATFTVAGVVLTLTQRAMPAPLGTAVLGDTAAGAAAFAAGPAAGAAAYSFTGSAAVGMASALMAGALALAPVARLLVARRHVGMPVSVGSIIGAAVIAGSTFALPRVNWLDSGVGLLLLVAAALLGFTHSLDANRRADRWLDGADVAAGAVTAAVVAALARLAELASPHTWLVLAAALVLLVALAIRALPEELSRGPIAGLGVCGGLLGVVAGYPALAGGVQALNRPGQLWSADLSTGYTATMFGWQAPAALAVLAVAAAIALRPPRSYDAAAAATVLATVGAPAALGWVWWSPIVLGLAIAAVYAATAVTAIDTHAGYARFTVAVAVALHSLGSSLVRGWSTVVALTAITVLCAMITVAAMAMARLSTADGGSPPGHLESVGGAALLGVFLSGPGAFAVVAATLHQPTGVVLAATLAALGCCLLIIVPARRLLVPYLRWVTIGTALTGTVVAGLALLGTGRPGVYAAAAALFIVVAELLRTSTTGQTSEPKQAAPAREPAGPTRWRIGQGRFDEQPSLLRWPGYRGATAAAAAAAPTVIALLSLAEAIRAAVVSPYDNLDAIWQGPPSPPDFTADGTVVVAAMLLTLTAALAAVGFGGGLTRAVSVLVPGLAVTILVTPVGLGMGWAADVLAALSVFTLCVLSVALTQPPGDNADDRSITVARVVALAIGLAAGGAGLAGALSTAGMTIFTFGGAVVVGATAALGGRSEISRIMGWLGGAVAAELFVLSVSLEIGAAPQWAAFGVLSVGALLLLGTMMLPRLRRAEAYRESTAVEFAGYAAAAIAVALAIESAAHVAALLAGWGAVLGITAARPGRSDGYRRMLYWAAGGCEISAWWLIMRSVDVAVPEAYTLPFAIIALTIGLLELRRRPHLGSWAAYGPALVAGFGPTVVVVLITDTRPARQVILLIAAIATLIYGSMRAQRAPVAVGTAVTTITALHALTEVGNVWLAVLIGGIVLIVLGADSERRRRATDRYQQMR